MEIEKAKEIIKRDKDKTIKTMSNEDAEALQTLTKGLENYKKDKIYLRLMFEETIESSIKWGME
jgi:hypothetical protein